jgi:hypothetical protein
MESYSRERQRHQDRPESSPARPPYPDWRADKQVRETPHRWEASGYGFCMTARWARRHKARPTVLLPLLWVPRTNYRPAQPPEDDEMREPWLATEPQAPPSWPIQACLMATDTAFQAYTARYEQRSLVWTVPLAGLYLTSAQRTRTALEQRRARQLGLTIETAPQLNLDCLGSLPPLLVWRAYLRLRGLKQIEPWPYALAQSIIGEINRRGSWRRALTRPAKPAGPPRPGDGA